MFPETRLEVLEIKCAHLERALQELSDVLYRQQLQLDAQDARLRELRDRATTPEASAPERFEVPPHY